MLEKFFAIWAHHRMGWAAKCILNIKYSTRWTLYSQSSWLLTDFPPHSVLLSKQNLSVSNRTHVSLAGNSVLHCTNQQKSWGESLRNCSPLLFPASFYKTIPFTFSEFDPCCRHIERLEQRVFVSDCCQGSHWCILVMKTICNIYRHNQIGPLGDNISTSLCLNCLKGLPVLFTVV